MPLLVPQIDIGAMFRGMLFFLNSPNGSVLPTEGGCLSTGLESANGHDGGSGRVLGLLHQAESDGRSPVSHR